ncbi:O-antigen ligase family protein [Bacteroidales bacterium OttesenSCG-928-K03]|nr:O-antigen ligase family protein [Odoribacter sp. OttesenSCG-928-L07]MDL2242599.1 O-antigen ligase family protein [Bacteroidales bacterium OttesenSCG-928-K03]
MSEKQKIYGIYAFCAAFIIFVAVCVVKQIPWLPIAVPVLIGVACLYFFALDKVLLIITFLTPLSITLKIEEFGITANVPDEPMLLAFSFIILLKVLYDRKLDKQILNHPVSIFVIINLIWYLITCFTSELPLVSFKHLLAQLWFIIPCYFVAAKIFKSQENINKYQWAYIIAMIIVVIYTLIHHSQYGFSKRASFWAMKPFFPEHTSYGAIVVFILPFLLFYTFDKEHSKNKRLWSFAATVIVILGIIFSYTRAAWVSGLVALAIFILFKFRIKMRYIVITGSICLGLFFAFQDQILLYMSRNTQASSQDFVEHLKSATNISSDASNLERINRWQSALRMYKERPVFGWGPGTYQFVYAPFQLSKDKTISSTNAGDKGNAHSEYLGPLSERGLLGIITTILMFLAIIVTANKIYWKSPHKFDKNAALCCMLALITYMVHGIMNNYLDIDKAAVIFWLNAAIIVSLDIKYRNESKQLSENNQQPAEEC